MKKYINSVLDTAGNALPLATVEVLGYPNNTAVVVYSDDGVTVLTSSIATCDSRGVFSFYAPPGRYNLKLRNGGTVLQTITDVQIDEGIVEEAATIAAMKAIVKPADGQICHVASYYANAIPDGGGGTFKFDGTTSAADNGGTIIAPDAGGVGRWRRVYSGPINVLWFGAKGDGATNDAAKFTAADAVGLPLYIPYTAAGYKVNTSVTFNNDVHCDGFFVPDAAIGSAANDYDRFAIVIASAGYAIKRRLVGIKVVGSAALRTANVSGIRNDAENSHAFGLHVSTLNYGIVARSYSQTYEKSNANLNNTNFDAYARSSVLEINALTIHGGNYDSAVNAAVNIGDTTWSDALAAGNSHGTGIIIDGEASFDGAEVRIDNVYSVRASGYFETSATGIGFRLGGSGDGNLRDVEIEKSYFKTLTHAVRCYSGVSGLKVRPSFYSAVTISALHLTTNLYPFSYELGVSSGSFALGQEVHTGFPSVALGSVTWGGANIDYHGLARGIQTVLADPGMWYPGGSLQNSVPTVQRMNYSSSGRFYTTPALTKAGTVSGGTTFTFTTVADSYAFNGGDRIATSPAGVTYVRSVDYATGVMVMDGGTTANGAATVSQIAASFNSTTTTYSGAAPASGTWAQGDRAVNGVAAVGQPKAWLCTVAGTPGTWVSEGNL